MKLKVFSKLVFASSIVGWIAYTILIAMHAMMGKVINLNPADGILMLILAVVACISFIGYDSTD